MVIVIVICIISFILIYHIFFGNSKKEVNFQLSPSLKWGDESPTYSIKNDKGEIFSSESLRGKVKLFLFLNSSKKLGTLKYANRLFLKYRDIDFIVFGIYGKNFNLQKNSPDLNEVDFPLIKDAKYLIFKTFLVSPTQDETILIDEKNIVRFSASWIVENEILDMLMEKYVIDSSNKIKSLEIGQRIPIFHVWNVGTKQKEELIDLRDTALLIFNSDCVSCDIAKYFKNFEISYKDSFEIKGIFPDAFLLSELSAIKRKNEIESPFYLVREGSEILYSLFIDKEIKTPLCVYINKEGIVDFIIPL